MPSHCSDLLNWCGSVTGLDEKFRSIVDNLAETQELATGTDHEMLIALHEEYRQTWRDPSSSAVAFRAESNRRGTGNHAVAILSDGREEPFSVKKARRRVDKMDHESVHLTRVQEALRLEIKSQI